MYICKAIIKSITVNYRESVTIKTSTFKFHFTFPKAISAVPIYTVPVSVEKFHELGIDITGN